MSVKDIWVSDGARRRRSCAVGKWRRVGCNSFVPKTAKRWDERDIVGRRTMNRTTVEGRCERPEGCDVGMRW